MEKQPVFNGLFAENLNALTIAHHEGITTAYKMMHIYRYNRVYLQVKK